MNTSDDNSDGYNDGGFCIEIDPSTKKPVNQAGGNANGDKLRALGNFKHENTAIHPNGRTVYLGSENSSAGHLFKFVADVVNDLSSGTLYVLLRDGETASGDWVILANSTQLEINSTQTRASQ
ncbi:MAG: secreted PhoX family phosphatase [Sphingobacteriales bacterium]